MYQIDSSTAVTSLPAPAVAGTAGYFALGGSGSQGTQVTGDWLNAVQGELLSILAAAGVSPAKLSGSALVVNQVLQSLKRIASANAGLYSTTAALTADAAGIVFVNATSGNVVLTLPPAAGAGGAPTRFEVVRVDNSANSVTINPNGSDAYLPGSVTTATLAPYETVTFQGDGSVSWRVQRLQDSSVIPLTSGSGNITCPAGYTGLEVMNLVGAGGGAGGCDGTYTSGGGGAGGTTRKYLRGVTPGTAFAYAIGAAGTGGTGGASGSAGGASTLSGPGLSLTANGGSGGTWSTAPSGGDGGTASGGDENFTGGPGTDGYPAGKVTGGNGGVSALGGGGRAATTSSALQNGHADGSGGGAAYLNAGNGGNGASGYLGYRWRA